MHKLGFVFFSCLLLACHSKKVVKEEGKEFTYEGFAKLFKAASLPYEISDAALMKSRDSGMIHEPNFAGLIPDSIKNKIFSRSGKIKYYPMVSIKAPGAETYFLVKAVSGERKAALLLCFDKESKYAATLPFLVPDDDETTVQNSSIDKSYTISRSVVRKKTTGPNAEGRNVYVYNSAAKAFTLIMTDALEEHGSELINPIDTFPRTRKFAGDYVLGKKNIVSIRNGRIPNQALAFLHLEKNDGECVGELKGEILFTSTSTAIFRQGGDPCVLQFSFTATSVTLKEEQGCGNHRGLNCVLDGTYAKKKEKIKTSSKRAAKK